MWREMLAITNFSIIFICRATAPLPNIDYRLSRAIDCAENDDFKYSELLLFLDGLYANRMFDFTRILK